MPITFEKISKKPAIFERLFGVSVVEFERILEIAKPEWDASMAKRKCHGRGQALALSEQLLVTLMYFRCYVTQVFLEYIFDVDESTICRIIGKMQGILLEKVGIKNERIVTREETEKLIVDATESRIEKPKHNQRSHFSGKKRCHTIKTEVILNSENKIVHVSESVPGTKHDFQLRKESLKIPDKDVILADSGYQGLQKIHKNTYLPYKQLPGARLTDEQRSYNRELGRDRIAVEHKFAEMKTFKILSYTYRNKKRRYNEKFRIIAGIVNLKCEMRGVSRAS